MLRGCQYTRPIIPCGETVLFRYPESTKAHNKFDAKWARGIWVGRSEDTNEVIVLTPAGAEKVRF
eukprot:9390281-Alexandrium_andersonii.AAC.1